MLSTPSQYFCVYYGRDIVSYLSCLGCSVRKCHTYDKDSQSQEHDDYISCGYCRLKQDIRVNTVLPKGFNSISTDYLSDKKTLLMVRSGGGIGDMLMITPTLRELKRRHPKLRIIFQTAEWLQPLLWHNLDVDELIDLKKNIKTDALIDFSNPCPCIRYELDHIPRVDKGRIELFAIGAGVNLSSNELVYKVTTEERKLARAKLREMGNGNSSLKVGFGLKSSEVKRDWEIEKYNQLAEMVGSEFGGKVFAFHSKPTPFASSNGFGVYGQPLREVAAMISLMDVFVSSDNGLFHLAAAVKTPSVGIFGPTDPLCRAAPYSTATWVDKSGEVCPNSHCWYSFDCGEIPGKCIKEITPENILEKVRFLLTGINR